MDAPTKPVPMEAVPAKITQADLVEPYRTESMSVEGTIRGGSDDGTGTGDICCGLCAAFACYECCKCCC